MNVEAILRGFMKRAADFIPLNPNHPTIKPISSISNNTANDINMGVLKKHMNSDTRYDNILKPTEGVPHYSTYRVNMMDKMFDSSKAQEDLYFNHTIDKIKNNVNNNSNKLAPYIYHGANSNINSSMILEGDLRGIGYGGGRGLEIPALTNFIKRTNARPDLNKGFLAKNPFNSLLVDSHGGGRPGEYELSLDSTAIGKNNFSTLNKVDGFSMPDLRKAIGDKATNVHNLFFSTCNQERGCAPTKEITENFPNMTNMVATPQGRLGYGGDIPSIGLGRRHSGGDKGFLPGVYNNPIQYLKGTNGQWTTNLFKGYNK